MREKTVQAIGIEAVVKKVNRMARLRHVNIERGLQDRDTKGRVDVIVF